MTNRVVGNLSQLRNRGLGTANLVTPLGWPTNLVPTSSLRCSGVGALKDPWGQGAWKLNPHPALGRGLLYKVNGMSTMSTQCLASRRPDLVPRVLEPQTARVGWQDPLLQGHAFWARARRLAGTLTAVG